MAEAVGVEPTRHVMSNAFQEHRHRPLGHASILKSLIGFSIDYIGDSRFTGRLSLF